MKQIKQTLTEELSKMKYMLGYQRGMVISEQKLSIRQLVEKDIATENLGLTWAQVKQSFGTTGIGAQGSIDNQNLYKAWKGGWRPGKPVPDQYQTPTYKQNNQNATGVTTTTTTLANASTTVTTTLANASTTVTTTIPTTSEFLVGRTEEEIQQKIEGLKEKVKEARKQKRMTKRQCKDIANAIDSKSLNPFKIPVADQEMCDTLRFCISQGAIEDTKSTDWSACDAFPAKSTTTTTTASPVVSTTTTASPVVTTTTTVIIRNRQTAG